MFSALFFLCYKKKTPDFLYSSLDHQENKNKFGEMELPLIWYYKKVVFISVLGHLINCYRKLGIFLIPELNKYRTVAKKVGAESS